MMGLTHFFDNDIAGSMHGEKKTGLTALGRRLVPVMEDRGIIIDLAHSSHATFAEVMQVARRPVVISHGGVKGTCDTNRNLTDAELRLLARNGGMIGIGYWDAAVCAATPQATAKAILYAARIAGIDHVGLGSDFDGSTTTGFDTAHIDAVTQALLAAGMAEADIAKVMGGNALRLLAAGLAPLADRAAGSISAGAWNALQAGRYCPNGFAAVSSRSAISMAFTPATRPWSGRALAIGARTRRAGAGRELRSAPGATVQARSAALRADQRDAASRSADRIRHRCGGDDPLRAANSRRCRPKHLSAQWLVRRLAVTGVVTGGDFTFGRTAAAIRRNWRRWGQRMALPPKSWRRWPMAMARFRRPASAPACALPIRPGRRSCSPGPSPSAARSSMAPSSAARSGFPPPTCG